MAAKHITDEELMAKIKRESTERLQEEVVKKGLKTEEEVKTLDRPELIKLVFEARKVAIPVVEPAKEAPEPAFDMSQFLQLMMAKEAERDKKEEKEKLERKEKEEKEKLECKEKEEQKERKEEKEKLERKEKDDKEKLEHKEKEDKEKLERNEKVEKEILERKDKEE